MGQDINNPISIEALHRLYKGLTLQLGINMTLEKIECQYHVHKNKNEIWPHRKKVMEHQNCRH